jgi:hypothetical protein
VVFLSLQFEIGHGRIPKPCLLTIPENVPALFNSTWPQVYKLLQTQLIDLEQVSQATGIQG